MSSLHRRAELINLRQTKRKHGSSLKMAQREDEILQNLAEETYISMQPKHDPYSYSEKLTFPAAQEMLTKAMKRGSLTTYEGQLGQAVLDRARKVAVEAEKSKCVKYADLAAIRRKTDFHATQANSLFARSVIYAILTSAAEHVDYTVSEAKSHAGNKAHLVPQLREGARDAALVFGLAEEAIVLLDEVEAGSISAAQGASRLRDSLHSAQGQVSSSEMSELTEMFLPVAQEMLKAGNVPAALEARKALDTYTNMAGLRFSFGTIQRLFLDLAQGKVHSNDSYVSPQVAGELKYLLGLGCKPSPAKKKSVLHDIPQWGWIAGGAALAFLVLKK